MKANYKNWMPKGMIKGALISTVVLCALTCIVGIGTIIGKILLVLTVLSAFMTIWMFLMYRAFSYNGKRQMSKQIIEGVSSYVKIPDGGVGLDVGFADPVAVAAESSVQQPENLELLISLVELLRGLCARFVRNNDINVLIAAHKL